MLWSNLLWVVLPLLIKNVQAAETYFGNNRNWNLRRPIALGSRPNPTVNSIHTVPEPLSKPIKIEDIYNGVPENKKPVSLEEKITENYYDQSTSEHSLPPSKPEPSVIFVATEPTTIEELQTTSLYTNPPEATIPDDIQFFKTSSNPTLRRGLIPRPVPTLRRIEPPQPALDKEITTTATVASILSSSTVSIDEKIPELNSAAATITINSPEPKAPIPVILPESQSTASSPKAEVELITKPEESEIEILKSAPKEESLIVKPEAVLEIHPEESPKPEVVVVVKEKPIRPVSGYAVVRNYRPLAPLIPIRRPDIGSYPYRVPQPVVSSPRPKIVVTQPLSVKPTPPKVSEPKPIFKSILPSNPDSEWTTSAPTQLHDYQCQEADGYYGMAGDCDNYVECKKHIAIMLPCPNGLHFNPRARWPEYPCGYPSEVTCESNSIRQAAHPTDECPQQYGFYPMPDSDCSRYIMCQEGKAFAMNCPSGLAFNAATSSCDWPENVPSCKPDVFRGFSCPVPPLEEDGSPSDMIFKYRYRESCKEYIACQRGHPRLLRCDAGLSFDEESEICIDSDYVSNCKS